MKKIIEGRRFDTDRAKKVAFTQYSYPSDFHWWRETLYRKNTGEFFLHGEGGPMSRYAVTVGQNEWEGGEKISPLKYEAAKEWAEKNLDADEYEEIFGVAEDGDKKTVCFRLTETAIEIVKEKSTEAGMTMSDWLEDLIRRSRG
jgi:hypothetical protein